MAARTPYGFMSTVENGTNHTFMFFNDYTARLERNTVTTLFSIENYKKRLPEKRPARYDNGK